MFIKKFSSIVCCLSAFLNMSSYVSAKKGSININEDSNTHSPSSRSESPKTKSFTITIPNEIPTQEDVQDIMDYAIKHPEIILDFIHNKAADDLFTEMVSTISKGAGESVLFPQQEENLEKIDDKKRLQFMSLSKWILNTIKPEIKEKLETKILKQDEAFIKLVNKKWGEGIYTSYVEEFNTSVDSYEIPSIVLDGCTVETILSTPPDFFPSDADSGFETLVNIIKMVSPYVSKPAKESLNLLTKFIKEAMEKYTPQAIATTLEDHSKEDVQSSIKHFDSWVVLAKTLEKFFY